jgi:hypothetical protein
VSAVVNLVCVTITVRWSVQVAKIATTQITTGTMMDTARIATALAKDRVFVMTMFGSNIV